jgi:hypothetical protein
MKNFRFILLLFILPFLGFAQTAIKVKEVSLAMSKGTNNGFEVEIPQSSAKDVERDWKRRLSAGSKARLTETNGEIAMRGWEDKEISRQTFNLYSIISSTESGVKLTVWFTYNDTTFFTAKSGKADATAASRFVHDFGAAEYFLAIKNAHQKAREKLDKLKDELEKNVRIEEKSALIITENKRAIARAQEDLAINDNDQKEAAANITLQQAEVTKARAGNAEVYKAANKSLEEQQDGVKKLQGRAEDLHKKVDELNKENAAEDRSIATAKQTETQTTDAISKQKLLIKDLETKLKTIR